MDCFSLSCIKKMGFQVELFDCTFYKNWTNDETKYNTANKQYKATEYSNIVKYNDEDIHENFKKLKERNRCIVLVSFKFTYSW